MDVITSTLHTTASIIRILFIHRANQPLTFTDLNVAARLCHGRCIYKLDDPLFLQPHVVPDRQHGNSITMAIAL